MQNFNNKVYIDNAKIIDIKSEILCREAEDDFFYFNNINAAYKKLNKAVKLTPFHLKSLLLLADICFMKGFTKKALSLYKRAEIISPLKAKILASVANCNYILQNFDEALRYCNKAIEQINSENQNIYPQIIELKINIFIREKNYKQAYITFIQAQNALDNLSLKMIYNINYEILSNKLNLQKKLKESNLKIV